MALACRNCRVPLIAASGCAVCDPFRRHLAVVDEDEDDRPSLAGVGAEVVAGLRAQLREIRKLLKDDPGDLRAEGRLLSIGNTAAKVLEAARKLQVDGVTAVNAMSFAERAELFVTWVTTLPPAYRASLRDKLDAWERDVAAPIPAAEPMQPREN